MTTRGAMPKEISENRKTWEEIKLPLMTASTRLDLVELRIKQALDRFGCTDLLGSALRNVREIRDDVNVSLGAVDVMVGREDWFKGGAL